VEQYWIIPFFSLFVSVWSMFFFVVIFICFIFFFNLSIIEDVLLVSDRIECDRIVCDYY